MKSYTRWTFDVNDDALMALLFTLPFESFEEDGDRIHGYIPTEECIPDHVHLIHEFAEMFGAKTESLEIPPQNWNALWESNFSPVEVGAYCRIKADFHDDKSDDFEHQITINPKMAFGTGHHHTTFMMIETMQNLNFQGKKVLDYGCGTGILAILASLRGAEDIVAIDIEEESYRNTLENSEINKVSNIRALAGTLDALDEKDFDIVLANINRNVLLETSSDLMDKLRPGGVLLLSGILHTDEFAITESYAAKGLILTNKVCREDWICLHMKHEER